MSYDSLKEWSRKLHKMAPINLHFREKIPYKTILIVIPISFNHIKCIVVYIFHWRNNIFLSWLNETS